MSIKEEKNLVLNTPDTPEDNNEVNDIECGFKKAVDQWRSNSEESFELLNQIIKSEIETPFGKNKWSLKCYKYLLFMGLFAREMESTQIQGYLAYFQYFLNSLTSEESENTILEVINASMNSKKKTIVSLILPKLLDQLSSINLVEYCNVQLKLCKQYFIQTNPQSLLNTITQVEERLQNSIELSCKSSFEVEILVFRALYYRMTKDQLKIESIYKELVKTKVKLQKPFISGVIYLIIGQEKAFQKKYKESRVNLMKAYYCLKTDCSQLAKQALVYGSAISILENYHLNIFDDSRTKVYHNDIDVQMLQIFRLSYETKNVDMYRCVLNSYVFEQDWFLLQLQPRFHSALQESWMRKLMVNISNCKTKMMDQIQHIHQKSEEIDFKKFQKCVKKALKKFGKLLLEIMASIDWGEVLKLVIRILILILEASVKQ